MWREGGKGRGGHEVSRESLGIYDYILLTYCLYEITGRAIALLPGVGVGGGGFNKNVKVSRPYIF